MNRPLTKAYSLWFLFPAAVVYGLLFLVPTLMSFFFAMTRWTLSDWQFTGIDNFTTFFSEPSLNIGLYNTVVYALVTCALKVILGFLLAIAMTSALRTRNLLRSLVFFPVLVSTIAVGITFSNLLHPTLGVLNQLLSVVGVPMIDWLGDPNLALFSVALVDVWKGVGMAMVIFVAGILSIPADYYEAMSIDGAGKFTQLLQLTIPLARPAINSVILLSFIGGLRTFDLVWTMTGGGPGFATDMVASIIYKQYQGGFYGLATAGNVVLVVLVAALVVPLNRFLSKAEVDL